MVQLNKGDKLFYARILPKVGLYEVYDLIVRTVNDTYFVAIDKKDKRAHLLEYNKIGKLVFNKREDAVKVVNDAEKKYPKINFHTCDVD